MRLPSKEWLKKRVLLVREKSIEKIGKENAPTLGAIYNMAAILYGFESWNHMSAAIERGEQNAN